MADATNQTPLPLRALQRAMSKAIELDPATANRLSKLEGRSITVTLNPPGWLMGMQIRDGNVELSLPDSEATAADLAVSMPPAAILAQLARAASGQASAAKGVKVAGDAELASTIFELAHSYEPDTAELLTPLFGDVLGQQLALGLQGAARFAKRGFEHLARNTSEYLREESRDLVAPTEMSELVDDIDELRDDVARTEARIQRLARARP